MGSKDTLSKQYVSDNTIFADICNFYIYQGEQIIQPEHLHTLDITESITLDNHSGDSVWSTEKRRDVIKYASIDNLKFKIGDAVKSGDIIGTVGSIPAECEDKEHIHIEVYKDSKPVDPLKALGLE